MSVSDKVGRRATGRYIDGSDLRPQRFQRAVIWLILKISGKCPISNRLLKGLYKGNDIGVEINPRNFPGIPQNDELGFLSFRIISATLIGEVFILLRSENIFSLLVKCGTGSSDPVTVAFAAKWSLKILAFISGSLTVTSFSIRGGIEEVF